MVQSNHKTITGSSPDQFQLIMDRCDLDHDGKIDYSEFIQAAINHQSLLNEKNIRAVFGMFDLDKDGRISIIELK